MVGIAWDLAFVEETAGRSIILGASDALEYPFIIGVPSLDVDARAARAEPLR